MVWDLHQGREGITFTRVWPQLFKVTRGHAVFNLTNVQEIWRFHSLQFMTKKKQKKQKTKQKQNTKQDKRDGKVWAR